MDEAGEALQPFRVAHAGLVVVDGRIAVQDEAVVFGAPDQGVDRERVALEGGAVVAEAFRGRTRDRDTEHLSAELLLGAGGGVDHDTLAGPCLPDQDGPAFGAGDDLERRALLTVEWCADPLPDRQRRALACLVADVATLGLAEFGDLAFDCLLFRA